jgi:hypothetical protein
LVGQLCDSGCNAIFSAKGVEITYQGKTIVTGYRNPHKNLWRIDLGAFPFSIPYWPHNHQSTCAATSPVPTP